MKFKGFDKQSSKLQKIKNSNKGKGIPLYIDEREPEINDPALLPSNKTWKGSNKISFKLLRCLEALRDLSGTMEALALRNEPSSDKRLVKHLSSPLYALGDCILDMFNELESNPKEYTGLESPQHKQIISKKKQFIVDVPMDKQSALRIVRDKIDSHIDKVAVINPEDYWRNVDLSSFLKWMGICLEQFHYLLSLDVYAWTIDSGYPDISSIMMVDGTVTDFSMQDGKLSSIIGVTFVKSPKYGVLSEIKKFWEVYNEVARNCQGVDLIKILDPETNDTESEQSQ
jgi:hypothetical protein